MECRKAQILFAPHIMGDPEPGTEQYRQLETHLQSCQACREAYETRKQMIAFIEQHEAIFAEVLRAPEERKAAEQAENERSWKRIEAELDKLEAQEKRGKFRKLFIRASVAAVCLVVGIFTWITFSTHSTSKIMPEPAFQQAVLESKPFVKIELVSENGSSFISDSQQIASGDKLKTLVINGKHRMIMNAGTSLSIEPLMANAQLGCLVKLTAGEIYTHVEHDGNPFIVDTANGKAVITGTTFDVKATDGRTTLVVSEGTVKFESESGVVKVAAGQTSEIVGQSAPSIPLSCNAVEFTAWAAGYKAGPALAKTELNPEPWDLSLSFGEKPIVLEETDYNQWVDQKREWFKKDFPWIFELKDALAREGIEIDYPELLIKSGDVWQFVCLQKFPARFSVPDFSSLLKAAISYGFDKEWLLKNVPTAKIIQNKSLLLQNPTGLAAFEQLLKYAKGDEAVPYYLYPADAYKYLAETRSLIWFAVKESKYNLTDKERTEVLTLLQEEVVAAFKYQNDALYLTDKQKASCCDDKCQGLISDKIELVFVIYNCEKILAEYIPAMSLQ